MNWFKNRTSNAGLISQWAFDFISDFFNKKWFSCGCHIWAYNVLWSSNQNEESLVQGFRVILNQVSKIFAGIDQGVALMIKKDFVKQGIALTFEVNNSELQK